MTQFKKPPPGEDLSQTDVARSLEADEQAPVVAELDFGLDDDPDLRTRPGQRSLRPPERRPFPRTLLLAGIGILVAVGAWLAGLLETVGLPRPAVVSKLVSGAASEPPAAAPQPQPEKVKKPPHPRRHR